jgi:hypothetical protein
VEVMELPFAADIRLVTVEVTWGRGRSYRLQTVLTR